MVSCDKLEVQLTSNPKNQVYHPRVPGVVAVYHHCVLVCQGLLLYTTIVSLCASGCCCKPPLCLCVPGVVAVYHHCVFVCQGLLLYTTIVSLCASGCCCKPPLCLCVPGVVAVYHHCVFVCQGLLLYTTIVSLCARGCCCKPPLCPCAAVFSILQMFSRHLMYFLLYVLTAYK